MPLGRRGIVGGMGVWPFRPRTVPGQLMGANAALGHRIRTRDLPEPTAAETCDVVIVGGGIAGLSAAWRLAKRKIDFVLLELERDVGGNASSGQNAVSAYPWGAHYVPRLTRESSDAAALFEDLGIIKGYGADGDPIYDEYTLCADPRERLFRFGRWQEDVLPSYGISARDRAQYDSFFARMDEYRTRRGADGRKAFAIPLDLSSADPGLRALDAIPMTEWMRRNGWDSEPLTWYVDYTCRDDYGAHASSVSAWAGIHYFASRDGRAADDDAPTVLTWPEGNGWIVNRLKNNLQPHLIRDSIAWRVRRDQTHVTVDVFDVATKASRRWQARAVILAVPRFVADRLLDTRTAGVGSYSPWMVANVTLNRMPGGPGMALSWDNVVYDSKSLGYVVATHQSLRRAPRGTVLTWYWPLCDQSPGDARRAASETTLQDWQQLVLNEMNRVHPEITSAIESVDVWVWGHGMIRPEPGYIWGNGRTAMLAQQPPIFFAHSDMSGISIFEEANHHGVAAANAVATWLDA